MSPEPSVRTAPTARPPALRDSWASSMLRRNAGGRSCHVLRTLRRPRRKCYRLVAPWFAIRGARPGVRSWDMDAGGWAICILIETDPNDADRARHVLAGALCPEERRPDHER